MAKLFFLASFANSIKTPQEDNDTKKFNHKTQGCIIGRVQVGGLPPFG